MVHPRSLDVPSPPIPEMAVVSETDGCYTWNLPPGRYEISVQAEGYRSAAKQAVVKQGERTTLNFVLEPLTPQD